jgi:hypothetical protein
MKLLLLRFSKPLMETSRTHRKASSKSRIPAFFFANRKVEIFFNFYFSYVYVGTVYYKEFNFFVDKKRGMPLSYGKINFGYKIRPERPRRKYGKEIIYRN